jgi:polysaccharide biosynthesis protein PslE
MDFLQVDGKEIPLLEAPQKYEAPPRRILYVLFKQKTLICTIFLALSVPAFMYLLLKPVEYIATAKVLVKPSREFLNVSPSNSGYSNAGVGLLPSPEIINTEVQIIKSPQLAERLVKDVPFPDEDGNVPPTISDEAAKHQARWMKSLIDATPDKKSTVIDISITSKNQQDWTAKAVNRAAELYLEEHLKVHKTQGIGEFYDAQEKKLESQLTQAVAALQAFQVKEKIIDAPAEITADLGAWAAFDKSLKQTESEIRETEQKVAVLDDQLKQQKATISSATSITENPVYTQIRNRLTALELERDGLLQRYTPEDRTVKDKQKEIDDLKKKLENVKPTSVGSESISLNDVHRRILNELLGARVQLKALNEKKAALTKQVENYSAAAADKKSKGFEYDRLLRDVNMKKQNLDLYKQKAEEARISDAMDDQKFSNAYILERANPPLRKAGRGFMVLAILTLIASAGAAVAAAFGIEYFNSTLRNENDIEDQIGLPVLATIQNYGDFNPAPFK